MKKVILLPMFILAFLQMNAQITFERADCTGTIGDSTARVLMDTTGFTNPTTGPNQIWDYTHLTISDPAPFRQGLDAYSDTVYPGANMSVNHTQLRFVGPIPLLFDAVTHYVLDNDEYSSLGSTYSPLAISLTPLTGGATDSLEFLESVNVFPDPNYLAWFPMNYGDTRTSDLRFRNPMLMSVSASMLAKAPFVLESAYVASYEVAGWGSLSLTNPADSSLATFDALLMTRSYNIVDSFFLYGQPAPAALLAAFGVTQGQVSGGSLTYSFWAKDFATPVLEGSAGSSSIYMAADFGNTTSIDDVKGNAIALQCYPNPATDRINLQFEKSSNEAWTFTLYNTLGQAVYEHAIAHPQGTVNEAITFQQQLSSGNYFYALKSGDQEIMSSGSLQIR